MSYGEFAQQRIQGLSGFERHPRTTEVVNDLEPRVAANKGSRAQWLTKLTWTISVLGDNFEVVGRHVPVASLLSSMLAYNK